MLFASLQFHRNVNLTITTTKKEESFSLRDDSLIILFLFLTCYKITSVTGAGEPNAQGAHLRTQYLGHY